MLTAVLVAQGAGPGLIGWELNLEAPKRIAPQFVALNPMIALAFGHEELATRVRFAL